MRSQVLVTLYASSLMDLHLHVLDGVARERERWFDSLIFIVGHISQLLELWAFSDLKLYHSVLMCNAFFLLVFI